jgi:hypothetical protein
MKKITLLAVAFVAISFASCKKNYNCECTTVNTIIPGDVVTSTTIKNTKKKATSSCEALNTSNAGFSTTTCKIK